MHAILLVVLTLLTTGIRSPIAGVGVVAQIAPEPSSLLVVADELVVEAVTAARTVRPAQIDAPPPVLDLPVEDSSASAGQAAAGQGSAAQSAVDLLLRVAGAGRLGNRSPEARAALVAAGGDGGPSRASEAAVERGLQWLAAHQLTDGSWAFDHRRGPCQGLCRNPGTATSSTAATGMALLAFLGAGYTHRSGEYREVVRRGLYYLQSRGVVTPHGIDLRDGTMYGQGLAAIALCEAYTMTGDESLRPAAEGAIDFVAYAQDRQGGGWRYQPHEPGDTTVTGWQIMALKSGEMAGLPVSRSALYLAQHFLDSVQTEDASQYGYMSPKPRPATTAIGLLCRMYAGWGYDHPGLQRGVAHLARWGPSETNIYYNYYATQVLFHWGGSDWKRWNEKLRDRLVATQARQGHEAGSWYFPDKSTAAGGRLCSTALAIMTLEVYYRYLPLYDKRAF